MKIGVGGRLAVALMTVALMTVVLVACSSIPAAPASPLATVAPGSETEEDVGEGDVMEAHSDVVAMAQADLAERLGVAVDQVRVREVREVVWPDASLGCPQPDRVYAQVEQAGLLITLSRGGALYHYHSGPAQEPLLCDPTSLLAPTPGDDEFVPPPGSEID